MERPSTDHFTRLALPKLSDRGLAIAVALAFACVVGLLLTAIGAADRFVPTIYMRFYLPWLGGSGLVVLAAEVARAIGRNPAHPLRELVAGRTRWSLRDAIEGGVLIAATALFYGSFTSLKCVLPVFSPFWADPLLADLDRLLHGGIDPWRLLQPLLGYPVVTLTIEAAYAALWSITWFVIPVVVAVHPDLAPVRRQFFLTMFSVWILCGVLLAGAFLSAGPAYFGHITGDEARFADLVGYHAGATDWFLSVNLLQDALWQAYAADLVGVGSGISAFPSLHVAIATLWLFLACSAVPVLKPLVACFWIVIALGSVHLGWHYALDGYASVAVTYGLWRVFAPRRAPRPATARQPDLKPDLDTPGRPVCRCVPFPDTAAPVSISSSNG